MKIAFVKHKSKLVMLILVSLIVILSILIYNSHSKINSIILGNDIEELSDVDNTFTSSFMTSTMLLKMLENDASKVIGDKIVKLSSLIKESTEIHINIGSVDINNLLTINYDKEILERQSEIVISNISNIIDLIVKHTKNSTIKIYGLVNSYDNNDETLIDFYSAFNTNLENLILSKQTKISFLSFLFQ